MHPPPPRCAPGLVLRIMQCYVIPYSSRVMNLKITGKDKMIVYHKMIRLSQNVPQFREFSMVKLLKIYFKMKSEPQYGIHTTI